MKKLTILTSVLALTACGGGSGGHSVGTDATIDARTAAISSNANITNMNSFVVIGGTNPTVNPNARTATTLQDGGTQYDLSDVEFKTASMLMNTDVNDSAIVKFETENGKISRVKMELSGESYGNPDEYITMNIDSGRTGDTNVFSDNGALSYKVNGAESPDAHNNEHFGLLYESDSKDNNLGLRYSDFGVIQWGDVGNYDTSNYFAGGYDVKRTDKNSSNNIDYTNMNALAQNSTTNKLTFTGVANGVVRTGDMSDDIDTHYIEYINKLVLSTPATLEFQNGKSTLTANFDNWYDVTATMGTDGKLNSLNFTNGNKLDENQNSIISDNFKWQRNGTKFDTHIAEQTRNTPLPGCGENCSETVVLDGFVEYYGDNGNPAEAVGVIRYGDSLHESGAMRFDMGFGGVRQ